jgi:hypothetical protein
MYARINTKALLKLKKRLRQVYYTKNAQRLYFSTIEVMHNEACSYDIYAMIKVGDKYQFSEFLFSICNIKAYEDNFWLGTDISVENPVDITKTVYENIEYTFRPYYFDGDYFIPKITGITQGDIEKAVVHYFRKVLNCYLLNYHFINSEIEGEWS